MDEVQDSDRSQLEFLEALKRTGDENLAGRSKSGDL